MGSGAAAALEALAEGRGFSTDWQPFAGINNSSIVFWQKNAVIIPCGEKILPGSYCGQTFSYI
jgi:hypothetical protein